jgi:lysozyme family protein
MNFDEAFELLLGHEGGYVNDPNDRGGETKFGISKRAYPHLDIKALSIEESKGLYKRDYWGPAGCDAVPDSLKFDLFDAAVNVGVRGAIKMLQRSVGETQDGVLGPRTLQAVQSMDSTTAAMRFNAGRLLHYTRIDRTVQPR